MAITSAQYTSSDGYRIKYVEDGVEKRTKQGHPDYDRVLAAIPVPDPFVEAPLKGVEYMNEITHEFWRRVALEYGVSINRAKTHVMVNGANAAVTALWNKASTLMDSTSVTRAGIEDDTSWT